MRIDEKDVTQDSVVPPAEAPPQTRREDIQLLDDEDYYMPPPEAVQPMGVGGRGSRACSCETSRPRHLYPPRERRPTDFYGQYVTH